MDTRTLETAGAAVVYDVDGPRPTAGGLPPLVMIGQPMTADGFRPLASFLPDRTVVTYDPRGLGRSSRSDGRTDNVPAVQAGDVHAIIEANGAGPVEMFASSGGAVTALALVAAHPDDVTVLVAHEPPLVHVLPDADAAARAVAGFRQAYATSGWGAGMAAFIAMTAWQGAFTDAFFAQPQPDPAQFGMPSGDDRARDDPLLSERSAAVVEYRPDIEALASAPTRIVIGVGEESAGRSPGARRRRWPRCSGAGPPSSPAITAASWAVTHPTRASPRPSPRSCATSSQRTAEAVPPSAVRTPPSHPISATALTAARDHPGSSAGVLTASGLRARMIADRACSWTACVA